MEPHEALQRLAGATTPFVIGVRHHSPACAAAVPTLLDRFAPTHVLLELPAEFAAWIPWLGHPGTVAPVALAGAHEATGELCFYPFADFSPELAAVRWAVAHGISVEPCDLPYRARASRRVDHDVDPGPREESSLVAALCAREGAAGVESLWDRMVEAPGAGDDAEAIRRAALLFGWALRHDATTGRGVDPGDLQREAYMRARLRQALVEGARVAAVVGAFHGEALLDDAGPVAAAPDVPPGGALIPYAFDLFDSRSGYPAGIRDPLWQQRVYEALARGETLEDLPGRVAVEVTRTMRAMGHAASVAEARESARIAQSLAALRGLRSAGRREFLEAVEGTMAHGETLGRGRALARALEQVLVGHGRGRLAPGVPRSGLGPQVEALVRELRLPGPGTREPEDLSLDPLRSDLDRRRHVTLWQLRLCGIPYATLEQRGPAMPTESLGARWRAQWTPATEAGLEVASVRGVTLAQAAEGSLLAEEMRARRDDRYGAREMVDGVALAAEAGLATLVARRLAQWPVELLPVAGLGEAVAALGLLERLVRGHVAGLGNGFQVPAGVRADDFLAASVRALEGLAGAETLPDLRALGELTQLVLRQRAGKDAAGEGRLGLVIDSLARDGSFAMQGAAGAAAVLLERLDAGGYAVRLGSWIDGAAGNEGHTRLAARLRGALVLAGPLFESHGSVLAALAGRVVALDDARFLDRLPALREGFEVLSPRARERVLSALGELFPDLHDPRRRALDVSLDIDPALLARAALADGQGRAVGETAGLVVPDPEDPVPSPPEPEGVLQVPGGSRFDAATRFRLILGRQRDQLPPGARRFACALDELYGRGHGEGSRADLGGGGGGGTEAPYPTVREWAGEIEALFGKEVREEVLARAAGAGRVQAALAIDPANVTPSVDLLEQLLSLKGALPERDLAPLRTLAQRIIDELVQALAQRVRPALSGLVSERPVRRRIGPLDLRRTVAQNLRTARAREDDPTRLELVPDRWLFRARSRRAIDWHVTLVVDVSGSMEASVIYSAMMASILAALPAVSVQFFAFSTEVIDLSERVTDPLALLLEVQVGGGTDIGLALRHARGQLRVPARTIVLLVSDFEEGVSVPALLAESRALVETGAKVLGLAALDDRGAPRYQRAIAELLADTGMPIAALSPLELARWVAEQIR